MNTRRPGWLPPHPWLLLLPWLHAAVQDLGRHFDRVDPFLLEYHVHDHLPAFAWQPYVHAPGYTAFMATLGWIRRHIGWGERGVVLWSSALFWSGCLWLLLRTLHVPTPGPATTDADGDDPTPLGPGTSPAPAAAAPRLTPALLLGLLWVFSPLTLRPLEHYPLATLCAGLSLVACVRLDRRGGPGPLIGCVLACFVAVELHLSSWFAIGGTMATLFFLPPAPGAPSSRRRIALASALMIGAFLLTTGGLWRVLLDGPGHLMPPEELPGFSLEWANPVVLATPLLWLAPPLRRLLRDPEHSPRARAACALGMGSLLFFAATTALQLTHLVADFPYPSSLHYYELIEPSALLSAVWLVCLLRETGQAQRARWLTGALLLSQLGLYLRGQLWLWRAWG